MPRPNDRPISDSVEAPARAAILGLGQFIDCLRRDAGQ